MKDLTLYEIEAISGECAVFVENMRFLALDCIVVISGRGMEKVAFDQDTIETAPTMLAGAYLAADKRKKQQDVKSLN